MIAIILIMMIYNTRKEAEIRDIPQAVGIVGLSLYGPGA